MKVEIWSDVVCPWCAIGRARFAEALRGYSHRDEVDVTWRSFELDPNAPAEGKPDMISHIMGKYGLPADRAEQMLAQVVAAGAEAGIDIRFDRARPSNSFLAHQLLHLAREAGGHGLEDRVTGRLFAAYLTEGEVIGDLDTLLRIAAEAGLDPVETRGVLERGRFAAAVRSEQATAERFGIGSVPSYVIDRTYLVPGAQPVDTMRRVLDEVRATAGAPQQVDGGEGDSCAEGGCAV